MNKYKQDSRKSVVYSQNFTVNTSLVAKLIEKSSITKEDVVYEIGPGTGIITSELSKKCKEVIAIEVDSGFVEKLRIKFDDVPNVRIHQGNILTQSLPQSEYKVFSNIPFNITAAIIKKLVEADNSPRDTFLFVQHEAAKKFVGAPITQDTQSSLLIKPVFELSIVHRFKRSDFKPIPGVDVVLLRIKKLLQPFVQAKDIQLYRDFIVYGFNAWRSTLREGLEKVFTDLQFSRLATDLAFSLSAKPSDLNFSQWLGLFKFFIKEVDINRKSLVKGSENKLKSQQAKLEKIHRTRSLKDWRDVGSKRNY